MPYITTPRPGNIQSIIIKKKGFSLLDAQKIAKEYGATNLKADETIGTYRFRQRNPSDFINNSLRSFVLKGKGVTIIKGKLKENKMSDDFRSIPILLSENLIPDRVQLLRAGKFHHDGREIVVKEKDLTSMVKNFSEKVRGIDLMIDFSHNSEGEAAGWIKVLKLSDCGQELWADVEWTPQGEKRLKDKSFRYISADFSFNYKDNENLNEFGATLFGAGLTNRPVVKSMTPIVLSEDINLLNEGKVMYEEKKMQEKEKLEEKEEMQEEMSLEQAMEMLKELKAKLLEKEKELEKMKGEREEEMKESEEMKAEMAEIKKAKELEEKNKAFDEKMSEGVVCEAQREAFIAGDMDKFVSLFSELKLSEKGNTSSPKVEAVTKENVEDKVIQLAQEKSKKEGIPLDISIGNVLSENPDLKQKYNDILSVL